MQVFELEKNKTDYLKTIISVRPAGNYQKVSVSQATGSVETSVTPRKNGFEVFEKKEDYQKKEFRSHDPRDEPCPHRSYTCGEDVTYVNFRQWM